MSKPCDYIHVKLKFNLMDKQTVYVKSNGLRNELKEIRKSIDALTAVMVDMVDAIDIATAQTNKRYENNYSKRKRHNNDKLRNPSNIL